jgi:Skp family chaperone for outer membrane proteins
MDYRAQYLQAMREQAPALFKRLSKDGELESHAAAVSQEAERMFRDLTEDAPKDENGQPTLPATREAEEYLRAALLSFPEEETSLEQDDGGRPLLSPDRST